MMPVCFTDTSFNTVSCKDLGPFTALGSDLTDANHVENSVKDPVAQAASSTPVVTDANPFRLCPSRPESPEYLHIQRQKHMHTNTYAATLCL